MLDKDHPSFEREKKKGSSEAQPNWFTDDDASLRGRPEVLQGSVPGNERIRFVRPRHPAFRRLGYGVLEATDVTQAPQGAVGRIKRLLIGEPIASAQAEHERLTKFKALAVLSSDAILPL